MWIWFVQFRIYLNHSNKERFPFLGVLKTVVSSETLAQYKCQGSSFEYDFDTKLSLEPLNCCFSMKSDTTPLPWHQTTDCQNQTLQGVQWIQMLLTIKCFLMFLCQIFLAEMFIKFSKLMIKECQGDHNSYEN